MPAAIPLIGAAAGLAGSAISANAQKKAAKSAANAAAFKPYDVNNLFGSSTWNEATGTNDQTLAPWAQNVGYGLQSQSQLLADSPFSDIARQFQLQGTDDALGAYQGAQGYQGLSPEFMQQIMGGYQNVMGANPGAQYSSQLGSNPFSAQMVQQGQQLLGQNYGDVQKQQLDLMRQQAAPQEDQATNALFQRLQKQGRMGSTGGGRDLTAFAEGLSNADTQRQLSSMGFAQNLRQSDQQIGANLFGTGNGQFIQGLTQAGNLGQNVNGQYLQALTGMQNFGQQQDATNYSRANDRVSRASDLFGFGSAINSDNTSQLGGIMQLLSGLSAQGQDAAALGANAGGAQASAGANAGRFTVGGSSSPVGGFFQGLGSSVLGSDSSQSALSGLMSKMMSGGGSGGSTGGLTADAYLKMMGG